MKIYVGLDVHSKQTSYCVQTARGRIVRQGSVETSEQAIAKLLEKIGAAPGTPVALETGTQAKWLARLLSALGMQPAVIDAGEVRSKSTRRGQKSDTRDAFEICDGYRRNQFTKIVWVPPAQVEQLRSILSRRRHFIKIRTSQINAARFLVRSKALKLQRRTLVSHAAWQAIIAREEFKDIAHFLCMHFEMWAKAQHMVEQLDEQLAQALKPFAKAVQQMDTAFGVGPITIACLIAALGDPKRFNNSNKVVSYLGCAPKCYDTGERKRRGGITKEGPGYARAVLCEAALQARRLKHPLHPYWARQAAKSGKNSANMAVAARLARILWRLWRDDKPFDLGKLNVTYQPQLKSKRSYYQIKEQPVAARA
jgi:transposase